MAKATKPTAKKPTTPEPESSETFTISVRFSEQQRALLARAAETRGWTLTNLVRLAALDRAAHIVNTAQPTSVDFNRLARQIAEQLFATHRWYLVGPHGEREECACIGDPEDGEEHPVIDVEPLPLPPSMLGEVQEAARFGGAEFMALIIDAGRAVAAHARGDLPKPIDPSAV